ncbi:MAG: glycosyltransferase family 2 protein, partial [Anaerolineae bacterium]
MAGNPTTHSLPSVTVIVLNYNTRRHLQTCFESLQQTDYPPGKLQLMLVDNASHDDSLAFMAANFPDVTVVKNSRNLGFAGGNNAGARAARGELVAFLNPDMRVDPGWLAPLVSAVQGRPEVACAAAKILTWDGKHIDFGGSAMNLFGFGYQVGWGDPAPAHAEPREILAPCGGAMLIDRQVFLQAGGFDEDYFAYYEDTDLGWRLWVLGHKVMYVPQAVVYHIHHGAWGKEADEKRRVLYERNALYSIIKNYEDASLQKILPAALLLFIRRARLASDLNLAHFRTEPPSMAPHRFTEAVDIKRRPQDEVYDAAYYRRQAQKA